MKRRTKGRRGPRLCPEQRLFSRFYEPLLLLHILDQYGQQRISRCPSVEAPTSQLGLRDLRRNFLDQLAYVCDHTKGGDTVTAVAIETQPSGVIFWLACNSGLPKKTISFLRQILESLRNIGPDQSGQIKATDEIAKSCIEFNIGRIRTYRKSLQAPLQICLKYLKDSDEPDDIMIADWLTKFTSFGDDLKRLCRFSYDQRTSHQLKLLQKHIGDELLELTNVESKKQAFLRVRHLIGRLGSHLKAAKVLVTAGFKLPGLFETFTIEISPSSKPSLLPPLTDHSTTLDKIIVRMFPARSEEVPRYQEALATMDAKFHLEKRLLDQFEDKDFKPRVHAELILLEFFHGTRRPFIDDDRFIGCSKPACYCCYQYISLHPGGFVAPSSHGTRYINWRPPDPIDDTNKNQKILQRDIMNKLISKIRQDALRHIEQRKGPSPWHPDSTTGITYSQNLIISSVRGNDDVSSTNGGLSIDDELSTITSEGDISDSEGGVPLPPLE